jgi:UDPglucose--hexose-1-phosphate uridylyltransferase
MVFEDRERRVIFHPGVYNIRECQGENIVQDCCYPVPNGVRGIVNCDGRQGGAMGKIPFEAVASRFTILSPQHNFTEETHTVEVRKDPLLGDASAYNPFLRDKAKAFFGDNDPELVRRLVDESSKTCIFCGDRIEKTTPKYPPAIVPEGRLRRGESVLFPNLFAIGKYHAVAALSASHFLKLSEFTTEIIGDGLTVARDFIKAVYRNDDSVQFATINANYLFPGGASLVHPHLQVLLTPLAYSYHARMIEACRDYHNRNSSTFHVDLIEEEKNRGIRYVAHLGKWHWMTAFSPLGSNEVTAIHETASDFAHLMDADIRALAAGISKVLTFYESLGYLSYNYSLYSVRQPQAGEGHRCILKIVNRQNLYTNYRNDDYFLQKMLQTELIITQPEELAGRLRTFY